MLFFSMLLLVLLPCSTDAGGIRVGYFKSRPCLQTDWDLFIHSKSLFHATSTTKCAISCNRNIECDQALFNASAKTCIQRKSLTKIDYWDDNIVGLDDASSLGKNNNNDDNNNYNNKSNAHDALPLNTNSPQNECALLTKQSAIAPRSLPTTTTEAPEKEPDWSIDMTFILPITVVTEEELGDDGNDVVYQASRVSHVWSSQRDQSIMVLTTKPRIFALNRSSNGTSFALPLTQDVTIIPSPSWENSMTVSTNLSGIAYENRTTAFQNVVLVSNEYSIMPGGLAPIMFANTVDEVKNALLKGYRRVESNPTRSVIEKGKLGTDDVHFDMTEFIVVESETELNLPLKVTSIKESVNQKKRYTFKHTLNNGSSVGRGIENVILPWTMETTWEKIVLNKDSNSALQELRQHFVGGKELRVVLDKEISTDIVCVTITSSEIILDLAQYLYPLKGEDCLKGKHPPYARFPVIVPQSGRSIECGASFQNSLYYNTTTVTYRQIDWFVSTRNWTKMFVLTVDGHDNNNNNNNSKSTNGSLEDLSHAVIDGKNVRVCVYYQMNSSTIMCHGGDSLHTTTKDNHVILQTPPFLSKKVGDGGKLDAIKRNCKRIQRLISTEGWIQSADYSVGQKAASSVQYQLFYRQEWFVQLGGGETNVEFDYYSQSEHSEWEASGYGDGGDY